MNEIGQRLHDLRVEKGLSIDDIQARTKIQKRYLINIEQGEFDQLPGEFYVRAFVKQYIQALGYDSKEFFESVEKDLPKTKPDTYVENSIDNKSDEVKRTTNNKKGIWKNYVPHIIITLAIIIVLALVVFIFSRVFAKPASSNNSDNQVIMTSRSQSESESSQSQSSSSSESQSSTSESSLSSSSAIASANSIKLSGTNQYTVSKLTEAAHNLVLQSKGQPVWLGVTVNGSMVWQGTLAANQSQVVSLPQNATTMVINSGNIGTTQLLLNNQEVPLENANQLGMTRQLTFNFEG
ncbi:DUF4115 domain-containing protein [Holzapfeliella sp. He02]|uniref:DUF4115 domain-containing protein n=1 Tax=Holzapfeliella saturejae TaxID=3082953 RepID=A0ABU8SGP5_9LACO